MSARPAPAAIVISPVAVAFTMFVTTVNARVYVWPRSVAA